MKSGPVIYLRNSDKEIQDNKNIIGNISFNKLIDLQNKENNTNNYSDELIFLDNDYEINYLKKYIIKAFLSFNYIIIYLYIKSILI